VVGSAATDGDSVETVVIPAIDLERLSEARRRDFVERLGRSQATTAVLHACTAAAATGGTGGG
jgi:hypothetical protein